MKEIKIIYTISILLWAVFSMTGCNKNTDKIISKADMANIIADMYLADQILEEGSPERLKADSMLVYLPIIEKYGYTLEDYKNSITYYLQEEDTYKQLHIRARKMLSKRAEELKGTVDRKRNKEKYEPQYWWVRGEVLKTPINQLVNKPFVRAFKWLVMNDTKIDFNILDTAVMDVPGNSIWWENTLLPRQYTFEDHIAGSNKETKSDNKLTNEIISSNKTQQKEERKIEKFDFKPSNKRIRPNMSAPDRMKLKEMDGEKLEK